MSADDEIDNIKIIKKHNFKLAPNMFHYTFYSRVDVIVLAEE